MFFFEPSNLKPLRLKQGATQTELAKASGVSQSLIAKIESGKVDPSYSTVKALFEALNAMSSNGLQTAETVVNTKLIVILSDEKIKDAIKKMKQHEISQIPIVEQRKIIGLVTESNILECLAETSDPEHFVSQTVMTIANSCPPTVPKQTPLPIVLSLLSHFPLIVVFDNHKYLGVITKSDVLNRLGGV